VADHPLWTDYVAAFGSAVGIFVAVIGVIVAGVALYYAARSAQDAEESSRLARRTADAAGDLVHASRATLNSAIEQLQIARAEHSRLEAERARRPAVDRIVVSGITASPGEEAPPGTFRIGFTNTGDKSLTEAVLTIMVDRGALPEVTNRWGDVSGRLSEDVTTERWPGAHGVPREFEYLVTTLDVARGVSRVQYMRLRRHGRFALRAKLFCADLDGDGPWIDVFVDVSETGQTTIDDLSADRPREPTAGRHAELTVE
jgi:hypothetical protein